MEVLPSISGKLNDNNIFKKKINSTTEYDNKLQHSVQSDINKSKNRILKLKQTSREIKDIISANEKKYDNSQKRYESLRNETKKLERECSNIQDESKDIHEDFIRKTREMTEKAHRNSVSIDLSDPSYKFYLKMKSIQEKCRKLDNITEDDKIGVYKDAACLNQLKQLCEEQKNHRIALEKDLKQLQEESKILEKDYIIKKDELNTKSKLNRELKIDVERLEDRLSKASLTSTKKYANE